MIPHKIRRQYSILLLVFSLLTVCLMASTYASDVPTVIVVDTDASIQTLVWRKALSLSDVLLARKVADQSTECFYHITNGTIKRYRKFNGPVFDATIMKPGDVVIYGVLNPEREERLKTIPALGAILEKLPAGGRP